MSSSKFVTVFILSLDIQCSSIRLMTDNHVKFLLAFIRALLHHSMLKPCLCLFSVVISLKHFLIGTSLSEPHLGPYSCCGGMILQDHHSVFFHVPLFHFHFVCSSQFSSLRLTSKDALLHTSHIQDSLL